MLPSKVNVSPKGKRQLVPFFVAEIIKRALCKNAANAFALGRVVVSVRWS